MALFTISRQAGSLGEQIALTLAKKMNYELITKEKIQGMSSDYGSELAHALHSFETETAQNFLRRFFFSDSALTLLFEALVLKIASGGNRVIVGRGAHIVLSNIPLAFKTRVVAPLYCRVNRIAERLGWKQKRALNHVRFLDRQREVLIKTIFQKDLIDPDLYDLVLDTEYLSVEASVELVLNASAGISRQGEEEKILKDLENRALAKRVESEIMTRCSAVPYHALEVTTSEGGSVAVSGYVRSKDSIEEIEQIVAGVPGVAGVKSALKYVATTL
jgi:cytidylate kinase